MHSRGKWKHSQESQSILSPLLKETSFWSQKTKITVITRQLFWLRSNHTANWLFNEDAKRLPFSLTPTQSWSFLHHVLQFELTFNKWKAVMSYRFQIKIYRFYKSTRQELPKVYHVQN